MPNGKCFLGSSTDKCKISDFISTTTTKEILNMIIPFVFKLSSGAAFSCKCQGINLVTPTGVDHVRSDGDSSVQ